MRMDAQTLTPHAVAGVAQGVKCMCSFFTSGTSRLRAADGGELQHAEREPQRGPGPRRRRPPGPGRGLLPGLRRRGPRRGRPEGLAQAVRQAGRRLNRIPGSWMDYYFLMAHESSCGRDLLLVFTEAEKETQED